MRVVVSRQARDRCDHVEALLDCLLDISVKYAVKKSTRASNVIPSSRWAAYASAGLASAFGGAGAMEAEIHYSGPVKVNFDVGTHSTIEGSFALEGGEKLVFDFGRFGAGRGSALFQ